MKDLTPAFHTAPGRAFGLIHGRCLDEGCKFSPGIWNVLLKDTIRPRSYPPWSVLPLPPLIRRHAHPVTTI